MDSWSLTVWSLTVDIPASDLVRRKSKIVRRTLGIPALHNLGNSGGKASWTRHAALVKLHKAALDAGLLGSIRARAGAGVIQAQLLGGQPFDVLLIRRAPRPLDCAIQRGEWKRGGRGIYGDNLGSSLKAGRDWTAKRVFGLDGDSSPLLRWHVGQEKSARPKLYQLSVVIVPAEDCECCGLPSLPARWLEGAP